MGEKVNKVIIKKLFESFNVLELAIISAKKTIEQRPDAPLSVLERLHSYNEILCKQRELAENLDFHCKFGNWDEVARHIKLINGLSGMIRDDAKDILFAIDKVPTEEKKLEYIPC